MAASMLLITLNFRGLYIGGELSGSSGQDDLKMLGLQVTAKILELLAMASLSVIILAIIRRELVNAHLPFGAVTASFQFSSIAFLWSKEFVAACKSKYSSLKMKVLLLSVIVVFTILGGTLGPAAATAGQPVLKDWPAGGTSFYLNSTMEELYPTVLDKVTLLERPCQSSESDDCAITNHQVIADALLAYFPTDSSISEDYDLKQGVPENSLLYGKGVVRNMNVRLRGYLVFEPTMATATVPLLVIARATAKISDYWFLSNQDRCYKNRTPCFRYYKDIAYAIEALQPVAAVKCIQNDGSGDISFARVDHDIDSGGTFSSFPLNKTIVSSTDLLSMKNVRTPNIKWTPLPSEVFGETSIGAVVAIPITEGNSSSSGIYSCTVDARWAPSTVKRSSKGGASLVQGIPAEYFRSGRYMLNSSGHYVWPQVKITPDWARHLDTGIAELNTTVFTMLCNSVAGLGDISKIPRVDGAVESILALMLAEGMSRDRLGTRVQGSLKGSKEQRDPPEWQGELGRGGSAYDFMPNAAEVARMAQLNLEVTVEGYGYGIGTATLLSCLVLLTYSFIALLYTVYLLCISRKTSASWDSIAEVISLAANSREVDALRNTGAGIASLKALECSVSIRVYEDEKVEMVFGDVGDELEQKGMVEKVDTGEFYK